MKFEVTLTAKAIVEQIVVIEAENAGLAEQKAIETAGDRTWNYIEVEDPIQAMAWNVKESSEDSAALAAAV